MRGRIRTAALVLAAVLAVTVLGCSKPWPPKGPTEDGPPLPQTEVASSTPAAVETSSAEPSDGATEAPAKDAEADTAELRRSASSAAVAAAKGVTAASAGSLSASEVKLAKSADGTWWASVLVRPASADVDPLPVYLTRASGAWKVVDIGTGVEPATDARFPKDVASKL